MTSACKIAVFAVWVVVGCAAPAQQARPAIAQPCSCPEPQVSAPVQTAPAVCSVPEPPVELDEPEIIEEPNDSEEACAASAKSCRDVSHVEYNTPNPYPNHGNTLAALLRKKGITPERIDRLEFSSNQSDLVYTERDRSEIGRIWDWMIETAEPYKFWMPSGYMIVKIYIRGRKASVTELGVNETDSTTLRAGGLRYMTHGLYQLIVQSLESVRKSRDAQKAP